MDIAKIEEAIVKYRQKFGHPPASLTQLVQTGIMASLPEDLDGHPYLYDPETGEVNSPTEWWKR
jgi:hypothetical protein